MDDLKSKVYKRFDYVPDSSELFILLPHRGGKLYHGDRLSKKLNSKGSSFLTYQIPEEILSADAENTIRSFEEVNNQIVSNIEELTGRYSFSKFHLIGASLGCVNAAMVSSEYPVFDKIDLIVPGNSLAESMWNGRKTQDLRKEFEEKGITLEWLDEAWRNLSPENNLSGFRNSNNRIFLSRADKIIPYENGMKLVEKMREEGIEAKIKDNLPLGHKITLFRFYTFPELFLNF